MLRQFTLAVLVCSAVAGCASTADVSSPPSPQSAPVTQERLRFAAGATPGVRSILLKPTLVEDLVVRGPGAGCSVLIGALFGSRAGSGRPSVGLALVLQAVGAPFGPALGVAPSIEVLIDGEVVMRGPIRRGELYHVEPSPMGPVETLLVPIDVARLSDIADAEQVVVQLGASIAFRLGEGHRRDFGELMSKISEDVNLARRVMLAERPLRKGQ